MSKIKTHKTTSTTYCFNDEYSLITLLKRTIVFFFRQEGSYKYISHY